MFHGATVTTHFVPQTAGATSESPKNQPEGSKSTRKIRKKKNLQGVEGDSGSQGVEGESPKKKRAKLESRKRKMKEKEKKDKDRHEKIVQSELFALRNIDMSDWVDSSKSSDYVPGTSPTTEESSQKKDKRL